MKILDFLIGLFLVNGTAHLVFGIARVRFLGLFGYSPKGNVIYGMVSMLVSLIIFNMIYGWNQIFENGIYLGGLVVFFIYLVAGKPLFEFFQKK